LLFNNELTHGLMNTWTRNSLLKRNVLKAYEGVELQLHAFLTVAP
jgi:hypothetical protein